MSTRRNTVRKPRISTRQYVSAGLSGAAMVGIGALLTTAPGSPAASADAPEVQLASFGSPLAPPPAGTPTDWWLDPNGGGIGSGAGVNPVTVNTGNGISFPSLPASASSSVTAPTPSPLWAQLITAYYLTQHQSEALGAYQRLRSAMADDLGINPGRDIQALHQQILRREPLDIQQAAQTHADRTVVTLRRHVAATATEVACGPVLRGTDGRAHRLHARSTPIGRSEDNEVVLADVKASRIHAAIIDTGSNFVITDLQSANGVYVLGRRIHRSAVLSDGDDIGIGDHHFTFEACAREPTGD